MTTRLYRAGSVVVALAAGAAGALLASLVGLPAPALVGSTLAVLFASIAGARPDVPNALRDPAFAVIGMTLGAGVTPTILDDIARWPLSLAGMVLTLLAATALAAFALARTGANRATALLATSPGALSYALALAVEHSSDGKGGGVDLRLVTVLQSIRLVAITVLVPPLVAGLDGGGTHGSAETASTIAESVAMLAIASLGGIALVRARVPAAWLIAGLLVSAIAHAAGWVEGRPAPSLLATGFVVAGAVIGSRFAAVTGAELRRMAGLGAALATLAMAVSAAGSAVAAHWLALPFGQVWVAYAPGGVEGMAAIALALGYDPVFVATHHIARLAVLMLVLPWMVRGP